MKHFVQNHHRSTTTAIRSTIREREQEKTKMETQTKKFVQPQNHKIHSLSIIIIRYYITSINNTIALATGKEFIKFTNK